jgi:hypothetical protein
VRLAVRATEVYVSEKLREAKGIKQPTSEVEEKAA